MASASTVPVLDPGDSPAGSRMCNEEPLINGQSGKIDPGLPRSVHLAFGARVSLVPPFALTSQLIRLKLTSPEHISPLVLAMYTVTYYDTQGRSLTHAFIELKTPPGKRDANSLFAMLSRLTSLQSLRILRELYHSKLGH